MSRLKVSLALLLALSVALSLSLSLYLYLSRSLFFFFLLAWRLGIRGRAEPPACMRHAEVTVQSRRRNWVRRLCDAGQGKSPRNFLPAGRVNVFSNARAVVENRTCIPVRLNYHLLPQGIGGRLKPPGHKGPPVFGIALKGREQFALHVPKSDGTSLSLSPGHRGRSGPPGKNAHPHVMCRKGG